LLKIVHLFYNFNIKRPMVHDTSIQDLLALYVELGELAGAAAVIWRDGQVIDVAAVGERDLITGLPVERDTIFRIASMSKPATTVAALTMLDEGRFDLDEPITRCAPEFARMRVLHDPEGPLDQTDSAPGRSADVAGRGPLRPRGADHAMCARVRAHACATRSRGTAGSDRQRPRPQRGRCGTRAAPPARSRSRDVRPSSRACVCYTIPRDRWIRQ